MFSKRRIRSGVTKTAIISIMSLIAPSVFSMASIEAGQIYFIQHKPTGNKMQVCDGPDGKPVSSRPGSNIFECVQWEIVPKGEYFHIRSVHANKYLKPDTNANGSPISIQPATWTGNWTQWSFDDRGDGSGHIINRGTGKQIFLNGRDRANIQQQPSSWRGDFTRWSFVPISGGTATPTSTPTTVSTPTVTPTTTPTVTSTPTPTVTPTSVGTPGSVSIEAESGAFAGTADRYTDASASGGAGVAFLDAVGAGFTLSNVPAATSIVVHYASQNSGQISVKLNGGDVGDLSFQSNGAWVGNYTTATLSLSVASGSSLQIINEGGDSALNVDFVEFVIDGPTPTPAPRTPTPTPSATPTPVIATVDVASDSELGSYLVAGDSSSKPGFTLYTFDNDNSGPSVCNGGCANTWPPYTVNSESDIIAPPGVSGLGVQTRQDGSLQVALNDEPLYFYTPDSGPGDTSGHGQGGVWWVADITAPEFNDMTWEQAALPACPDLYQPSNVPTFGFHTYIQGNTLTFNAGSLFASEVWGNGLRAVFLRVNDSTGVLEHIGTVEGSRNGSSATATIPSSYLDGKAMYYVSYERFFTPMAEPGKTGNALEYADSALYALNRSEGCVSGSWSSSNVEDFAGWARRQHPQGVFNDHNVFAKSTSSIQNSATHFMHVPRFVVKVTQDQAGQDLIFNVVFTYEADSPFSESTEIIFSGIEGKGARAGDGSPLHSYSFRCDQIGPNEANCNAGRVFSYGQNVDWELRVQPVGGAGANLYSQMFYYVPGHGWTKESVDPRAQLGGYASIDAHGATVYERSAAFMQHEHTASLQVVRDFVRQHQDLRDPIGTPVHGAEFDTCEACHINDGRSNAVFTLPSGDRRIAPPLIGLGLLEKVVDFPGKVGFGWKGDRATVEEAVRFALDADFSVPNPDPSLVAKLTNYSQLVGVPQRDKSKMFEPDVIAGESLFKGAMQCSSCHQEVQQLTNGDIIRPYTDLKTWDLGDGPFRTAPLWGIGRAANVVLVSMEADTGMGFNNAEAPGLAQRTLGSSEGALRQLGRDTDALFMHDGRASGLDEAVRAHGGAAASSRDAYINASQTQKNQLLEFLRSL